MAGEQWGWPLNRAVEICRTCPLPPELQCEGRPLPPGFARGSEANDVAMVQNGLPECTLEAVGSSKLSAESASSAVFAPGLFDPDRAAASQFTSAHSFPTSVRNPNPAEGGMPDDGKLCSVYPLPPKSQGRNGYSLLTNNHLLVPRQCPGAAPPQPPGFAAGRCTHSSPARGLYAPLLAERFPSNRHVPASTHRLG